MQVVLLKDLKGTGRRGEVKSVSDGYARNFLIPQKIAEPATPERLAEIKTEQQRAKKQKEKLKQTFAKLPSKLRGTIIEFTKKGDKSGTIFGSVSKDDIAEALSDGLGQKIEPSAVQLKHALKKAGEHEVVLDFGEGLKGRVKVKINLA